MLPALALVVYALSLVVGHFEEFRDRLPELSAFVDPRNLVWLLLAIGVVKVLHEFGHALACKHFGGEVHEMGFMLLVFSPCLYCDVSDAWRFPSKWKRIAVSAAGHDGRAGARLGGDDRLVVCPTGRRATGRAQHHDHLHGQHAAHQRQSADAVRRLLHFFRSGGNAEPLAAFAGGVSAFLVGLAVGPTDGG